MEGRQPHKWASAGGEEVEKWGGRVVERGWQGLKPWAWMRLLRSEDGVIEGPGWGSFADISKFRVEMKKAYGWGRGEMRRVWEAKWGEAQRAGGGGSRTARATGKEGGPRWTCEYCSTPGSGRERCGPVSLCGEQLSLHPFPSCSGPGEPGSGFCHLYKYRKFRSVSLMSMQTSPHPNQILWLGGTDHQGPLWYS